MLDWSQVLKDIEDVLLPHFECDIYERGLYIYLVRHTRLAGQESETIPLPTIAAALRCSEWQARKTIRSLSAKGCIELDQTRRGHSVKVLLPHELDIVAETKTPDTVDIEALDFYRERRYLAALLARERNRCFYCLSEVTEDSCELDHVVSQLNGGDNSYRNIVVSCHRCNTHKQGNDAEDYLRSLYRRSLLSVQEFEGRLHALVALREGDLKPVV